MGKKEEVRELKEMKEVVYDPEFAKNNPRKKIYGVHRQLKTDQDLRYDLTIMKPAMLGKEFVRTKGNMNKQGFQELYTVLEGKAIFFMQKLEKKEASDALAIKANPGDWVIVPPYYWIVTVNPSKTETLETGNWVSENTENQYRPLEKMGGPCYFYTDAGWIKNKNYKKIPELRFEKPLSERPESLDFLRASMSR